MKIRNRFNFFLLSALLASGVSSALATTFTWDNGAGNLAWDTSSLNWNGGSAWANATTNDAVFGASGVGAINLAADVTANKLTFNTAGYTLSGSTITLGGSAPAIIANESASINPGVSLGAAQTWTAASGKSLNLGGTVAKGGNVLTITGAGTVVITGGLSGTGGLYLNGGADVTYSATGGTTSDFRIGNNNATGTNTFTISGGDLAVTNSLYFSYGTGSTGNFNQTNGSLTLNAGIRASNQTNGITNIDLSGGTLNSTVDSFILNQRGTTTLTVRGTADATINGVVMSGWTANTSATNVNLDGGTLTTNGFWEVNGGPGTIAANGSCTSTLNFNGSLVKARASNTNFLGTTVNNAVIKEGGAKINTNGSDLVIAKGLSHGGVAATDGGLTKTGGGTLTLSGSNAYNGATTVNEGTLAIGTGGSIDSASPIAVGAGSLLQFTTTTGSRTVGNALSGTGNVLLSAGAVPNGSNGTFVTASGGWASFAGILTLDNTRIDTAQNISGLSAVDLVINDGSQVFANDGGSVNFGANSVTIAGRGHNSASGTGPLGALRIDNNHHYTGPVILAANAAIGNATFTGASYVDGDISGNFELEIIPRYGNWNTKVYLAGNNTFGSTRVSGGSAAPYNGAIGELIANSATALSSGPVVVDGGRLTLNGYSFSIANLSSTASGGRVQNGHASTAATLTVGTDGTGSTYGGTLADGAAASLALAKTGTGTLTLGGNNTYTGATQVNDGTLRVDGSLANTASVTVAASATLGGTGSISGPVTAAGTIAPGASVGTLTTTGNVALTGTYACEIDGPNSDRLTVTGNLDLTSSTLDVQLLTGGFTESHYVIATYTTRTGTLPNPAGYTVKYDQGAGSDEIWLVEAGGYGAWASANNVTGGINGDSDDDGVSNGIEYFMGQPGTGFTAMPGVVDNAGTRSVTWTMGNDYTGTYGTDFVVETSATLNADWIQETMGATVTINGNDVTYTFPSGPVRKFARLKVTGP